MSLAPLVAATASTTSSGGENSGGAHSLFSDNQWPQPSGTLTHVATHVCISSGRRCVTLNAMDRRRVDTDAEFMSQVPPCVVRPGSQIRREDKWCVPMTLIALRRRRRRRRIVNLDMVIIDPEFMGCYGLLEHSRRRKIPGGLQAEAVVLVWDSKPVVVLPGL